MALQTLFAVPLKCDACVQDVSQSLRNLPGTQGRHHLVSNPVQTSDLCELKGILSVEADLQKQLVTVEGTGVLFPGFQFICPGPETNLYRIIHSGAFGNRFSDTEDGQRCDSSR